MSTSLWYVACPRKDGKRPGIEKAFGNILFLEYEDAEDLRILVTRLLGVLHTTWSIELQ